MANNKLSEHQAEALGKLRDYGAQYPNSEGWAYAYALDINRNVINSLAQRKLVDVKDQQAGTANARYRINQAGIDALAEFDGQDEESETSEEE